MLMTLKLSEPSYCHIRETTDCQQFTRRDELRLQIDNVKTTQNNGIYH